MRRGTIRIVLPLMLVLVIAACRTSPPVRGERMYQLGADLTKLSAAVEAAVRYEDLPEGLSDDDLIALATKHDPGLVAPFKGYALRVAREDRHAIVLVCTRDLRAGLLEDAGCSLAMDRHLWDASPPSRCEFTLRVREVCGAPAAELR